MKGNMNKFLITGIFIALFFVGCGSKDGLSDFERENGVGPIKEKLVLDTTIDTLKAFYGKNIFEAKCLQCHKLDERYTGPAQRDVTKRRSPEYILNMILNPEEMLQKHPEAQKMLAEYPTKMTFQNVTVEEAKKILEYFRKVANEKP